MVSLKRKILMAAAFVLLPVSALGQAGGPVAGMTFPADPYNASSPLSRVHVPLAKRIAHGAGPDYPHHPSVHNGSGPMAYMALHDSRRYGPKRPGCSGPDRYGRCARPGEYASSSTRWRR